MFRLLAPLILSLYLMLPLLALAQEGRGRNPFDYGLKWYMLMIGAAMLGGAVAWWQRVKRGEIAAWSVHHLIGELVTSAFAGIVAFWIFEAAGLPPLLTAAFTGLCGHMGTRAIAMFEQFMARRAGVTPPSREK